MAVIEVDTAGKSSVLVALVYFLAALAIAGMLLVLGPPGIDQAAHSHLQWIFNHSGFKLWDNTWYLGRYTFVNYSYLLYVLAFVLGLKVVAAISVSAAVGLVSFLTDSNFPGAFQGWSRISLLVLPFMVLTGAWPFLLGLALALASLVLYRLKRRILFAALSFLTLLASPLALLALSLVIVIGEIPSEILSQPVLWLRFIRPLLSSFYVRSVVLLCIVQVISIKAFPDHGYYPYWISDLAIVGIFSAVCFALAPSGANGVKVKALIIAYGLLNLCAFFIKSDLGSNASRVVDLSFPIIVALLGLRKFRPRLFAPFLAAAALAWNFMPLSQLASTSIYRISSPGFWEVMRPQLSRYYVPGSRVELVDTSNHQGAYYLPKMGFPIVRGWFRQDDFPQNNLLYSSAISKTEYLAWLRRSGASLVVLTPGPYDFSAASEAGLIRSGNSGLRLEAVVGKNKIYGVPGSPTVVQGPGGKFLPAKIGVDSLSFDAPRRGSYKVSIFFTPYFRASGGVVCADRNGMTTWKITKPGPNRLVFDLSFRSVLSVLVSGSNGACR